MMKPKAPLDLSPDATWKQRFRSWNIGAVQIATQDAACGLVATNRSGVWQLEAWNVDNGELRQLTHRPNGKMLGILSRDGRFVYYHDDEAGNEIGHLVRIPYAGGDPEDLTPDLAPYTMAGFNLSLDGTTLALVAANSEGFHLYVAPLDDSGTLGEFRKIHHTTRLAGGVALSATGDVAFTAITERSGTLESSLLAIETNSGHVLGELVDDEASIDIGISARAAGDTRHMAATTRSGVPRPVLWDPRTGERTDFELPEFEGDLLPAAWSRDRRHLLVAQIFGAQTQLHRLELESGTIAPFAHPAGTVGTTFFDPNDDVVLSVGSSAHKGRLYKLPPTGDADPPVLLVTGDAPDGRRWRSITYESTDGHEIQGWLGVPDGDGPFPTVLETHGGPTGVMPDFYHPGAQAWLDHGFAYLTINYHGSTTFGRDFQKSIEGRLGELEVEDMTAARDWLVEQGIAEPNSILLTGWSYGGYLTLQALGMRPELWAGGMAGIAIADWRLLFEDSNEILRSYQTALFGGGPDEKPAAYARSSPVTYAERVQAPLLVIQGGNDTRCPPRQMREYEARMRELGKSIEVVWFEAGHGSYAVEQNIEHAEKMLRFAYDVLGEA
jgi:dipeptidyl aminopeptidase/acylaminoacyl peptidase